MENRNYELQEVQVGPFVLLADYKENRVSGESLLVALKAVAKKHGKRFRYSEVERWSHVQEFAREVERTEGRPVEVKHDGDFWLEPLYAVKLCTFVSVPLEVAVYKAFVEGALNFHRDGARKNFGRFVLGYAKANNLSWDEASEQLSSLTTYASNELNAKLGVNSVTDETVTAEQHANREKFWSLVANFAETRGLPTTEDLDLLLGLAF